MEMLYILVNIPTNRHMIKKTGLAFNSLSSHIPKNKPPTVPPITHDKMVETSMNARIGFLLCFDNEIAPLIRVKATTIAYVTLIMVTLSNRTIATFLCQRILKESQKSLKKGIDCSHNCQKNPRSRGESFKYGTLSMYYISLSLQNFYLSLTLKPFLLSKNIDFLFQL